MLLEDDDLPLHQTPMTLAHTMDGHPNAYDRFWFNGFREDLYFCVALGLYPNRGVIDAAFSTVYDGVQRSVFASARLARREPAVGPITIEQVEPMRAAAIRVEAPEHSLRASLEYRARTAACAERQTRHEGARLFMDVTRATQLGTWSGWVEIAGVRLDVDGTLGTKDRSWGIRPVGEPVAAAPSGIDPQLFFVWCPVHFDDLGFHLSRFEDADGVAWSSTGALLDPLEGDASAVDSRLVHRLRSVTPDVRFARGRRYAEGATLAVEDQLGVRSTIELEPVLTFRMRGAGYLHPTYAHGRYHGELVVGGEAHDVGDLDTTSLHDVHVEQVVRARWGAREGLGVLELLAIGPHGPSGLQGLLDGPA
jgi:hypothetical protein